MTFAVNDGVGEEAVSVASLLLEPTQSFKPFQLTGSTISKVIQPKTIWLAKLSTETKAPVCVWDSTWTHGSKRKRRVQGVSETHVSGERWGKVHSRGCA